MDKHLDQVAYDAKFRNSLTLTHDLENSDKVAPLMVSLQNTSPFKAIVPLPGQIHSKVDVQSPIEKAKDRFGEVAKSEELSEDVEDIEEM